MNRDASPNRRHPIDQLTRSHERLRQQLAELVALGQAAEVDRNALGDLVAWFAGQGARHETDEEESLFPRLRNAAIDDATRALLGRLADEHRVHVDLQAALVHVRTTAELAGIASAMVDAYSEHIAAEERDLFPAARELLGASDFEAIGAEMDARRGRAPDRSSP